MSNSKFIICTVFIISLLFCGMFLVTSNNSNISLQPASDNQTALPSRQVNSDITQYVTLNFYNKGVLETGLTIYNVEIGVPLDMQGKTLPLVSTVASYSVGYGIESAYEEHPQNGVMIPAKYIHTQAKWYYKDNPLDNNFTFQSNMVTNNAVAIELIYTPNRYLVEIKYSNGKTDSQFVSYKGQAIINTSKAGINFGQYVKYNESDLLNITAPKVVNVEVKSWFIYMFGIVAAIGVFFLIRFLITFFKSEKETAKAILVQDRLVAQLRNQEARVTHLINKRKIPEQMLAEKLKQEAEERQRQMESDDSDGFLKI